MKHGQKGMNQFQDRRCLKSKKGEWDQEGCKRDFTYTSNAFISERQEGKKKYLIA